MKTYSKNSIVECRMHGLAHDGRAVGKACDQPDGLVFFVRGAMPGQRVLAKITKIKKNFVEAELEKTLEDAPDARPAPCPSHGECGGCPLQTMPLEKQHFWKESFIREALKRIGGFSEKKINKTIASPLEWDYRNKVEFAFGLDNAGRLAAGLRKAASHKVISISSCLLMRGEAVKQLVRAVAATAERSGLPAFNPDEGKGFWRKLILRRGNNSQGQEKLWAFILTSTSGQGREFLSKLGNELLRKQPGLAGFAHLETNSGVSCKTVLSLGEPYLKLPVAGLDFIVGQQSFFQVNTSAAGILCRKVIEYAELQNGQTVWDLYCGAGLLGLALANDLIKKFAENKIIVKSELYGIESNREAVKLARINAESAGLKNCRFLAGEVHKLSGDLPLPDIVIADPPRSGMHPEVVKIVLRAKPPKIVLVSCNPATLARDIAALSGNYELVEVTPLDIFPHSAHIESIALMIDQNQSKS